MSRTTSKPKALGFPKVTTKKTESKEIMEEKEHSVGSLKYVDVRNKWVAFSGVELEVNHIKEFGKFIFASKCGP